MTRCKKFSLFKKAIAESFGTVKETSTLAEAKDYIDRIALCLDVYVTETGEPNTKVLGWITNVIVTQKSMV